MGRILIFLIAATIMTACGNTKAGKPMSVGEPYEVTIIAEENNLTRYGNNQITISKC